MVNVIYVVVATTKVHIFKQITTGQPLGARAGVLLLLPQRYIFSSKSQPAKVNHSAISVVVATTKVHIFKQITTNQGNVFNDDKLLLLPQRYIFSSKSQQKWNCHDFKESCCCYHKGTYFQANHNDNLCATVLCLVVVATTKVHIFKQITTF